MLKKRWENLLREKGYDPDIQVLNAYKPGLSWLMEVVQPRLIENGETNRMELAFRTFEAGPGGLEMKSRWLQEAFQGPDLLSRELGMDPGAYAWLSSWICRRPIGSGLGGRERLFSKPPSRPAFPACLTCRR